MFHCYSCSATFRKLQPSFCLSLVACCRGLAEENDGPRNRLGDSHSLLELSEPRYGGGTDITPSYLDEEDMKHFHGTYKDCGEDSLLQLPQPQIGLRLALCRLDSAKLIVRSFDLVAPSTG